MPRRTSLAKSTLKSHLPFRKPKKKNSTRSKTIPSSESRPAAAQYFMAAPDLIEWDFDPEIALVCLQERLSSLWSDNLSSAI